MWDAQNHIFSDYLRRRGKLTGDIAAAALYLLFLQVATVNQARAVAATVQQKLLGVGGLATTLVTGGQQWDAPNGWAPLQWIAVEGLGNYGFGPLAQEIAGRGVHKNIAGYQEAAKLVEKYNVTTTGGDEGRGGEYATQIGFGWTNGVLVALSSLYRQGRGGAPQSADRDCHSARQLSRDLVNFSSSEKRSRKRRE